MPSHNVAIQKAVFEALLREKRRGESFTQLFRRLLEQRGGLEDLVGAWGVAGKKADRVLLRGLRRERGR